jgi:alkylresorcinol/alkylpyrone synthase
VTRIVAARGAVPPHCYDQATITDAFGEIVLTSPDRRRVLERLHEATGVRTRHLALPLEDYARLADFGAANDVFLDVAVELGERAVRDALAAAALDAADVDVLVSTTVTGLAVPSIDARLVARLGLRPDVRRVPLFGLGCVAGAAGIARVHDMLLGHPDAVAVLLSVELCSLTVQRDDESLANLVASGLFGDGAAAVVLVGERRAATLGLLDGPHPPPRVVDSRSTFYPDTERVMGWDIGGSGFRIVLAASVADVVEAHLGDNIEDFLARHELKTVDVAHWIAHPGGPKVLRALQRTLELSDGALDVTWHSLADVGNLSSSSVLQVLATTLAQRPTGTREPAVMLAMGPGFCSEAVLLSW